MLNIIYIYGLIDPITAEVRYIGKSIRPKERLTNHMNEVSNCHRSHWLQSLKSIGLKPEMVILEELDGASDWQAVERKWIQYGRGAKWPLTNNTDGGDGVCGLPLATRRKMALTWTGRKHKPETLVKLRAARQLRTTSAETRMKMSASQKGRKIEWKEKIGIANMKITVDDQATILKRLADGDSVVNIAKAYNVHRGTITKVKHGKYPK